jgi:hypothetical protein
VELSAEAHPDMQRVRIAGIEDIRRATSVINKGVIKSV